MIRHIDDLDEGIPSSILFTSALESASTAGSYRRTFSGTPSLTSLIPEASSLTEPDPRYPLIFEGLEMLKLIKVWDEPIHASVERFHQAFNPLTDDDPMITLGAVNSVLLGKTAEETVALRDTFIR